MPVDLSAPGGSGQISGNLPAGFRQDTDRDRIASESIAESRPSESPLLSREARQEIPSTQPTNRNGSAHEPFLATTLRTFKSCKDAVVATVCYSTTGVIAQGTLVGVSDPSLMPNPFAYSMVRSLFAGLATWGTAKKGLMKMGRQELGMAALVGTSNTLWMPAYLLTDLASSTVIAYSAPLMHAAYDAVAKKKIPSPLTGLSLVATSMALYTIYQGAQHAGSLPILGNLCALAATLCLATFRVLVGRAAEKAKASNDPAFQKDTREKLDAVSFVSNIASFGIGAVGLPFVAGGLGANPLRTLGLGVLHGLVGGAAIHHNTRSNQQVSQVTSSLIGSLQVGLMPAMGYLVWGSQIPDYALVAGCLTLTASGLAVLDRWRQERRQSLPSPQVGES